MTFRWGKDDEDLVLAMDELRMQYTWAPYDAAAPGVAIRCRRRGVGGHGMFGGHQWRMVGEWLVNGCWMVGNVVFVESRK